MELEACSGGGEREGVEAFTARLHDSAPQKEKTRHFSKQSSALLQLHAQVDVGRDTWLESIHSYNYTRNNVPR